VGLGSRGGIVSEVAWLELSEGLAPRLVEEISVVHLT